MDALAARQVTGSTVFPTIRVASHPGKLLMGVFDDDDTYVPGTVLNRRAGEQGAPVPRDLLPAPVAAAEPEAIYAGPLYFHFGHFLLESLARSWYTRQRPDLPLVWAGAHTWQQASLRPWQTEILDLLGITQPTRIIADPTRFEKLHIPDIGYRYDDIFHPEHADFLGRYESQESGSSTRLWLSRNKLSTEWRDLNAGPTERHLADAGWMVINPEQLSVRQQLEHLSRAEVVAGEEGSAFHTIVLLRDVSHLRFEVFRRHGDEHRNMHTVGDARRVPQQFHTLSREVVLEATGRYVSKINPNSSEILDVLRVAVPVAEATAASNTDRAVERLLAEHPPSHLLAVGHKRMTPAVRSSSTAVAVSKRFEFDPRSYADDPIAFFELDLGQYAEHFHDEDQPFDVIWIQAGSFERFVRLFAISKSLATDDTTWIVGAGRLAARCALAVEMMQPGYTVVRSYVGDVTLLVIRRRLGDPTGLADIAALSDREVIRRLHPGLPDRLQVLGHRLGHRLRRTLRSRTAGR